MSLLRGFLLAALAGTAGCVSAEAPSNETAAAPDTAAPPAAEQLSANIPEGWIKVVDRYVGELHIVEYYPPDSTTEWEQKITVEALGGDDLPDPLVVADGLAGEQRDVCNDFNDNTVFAGFENGYATVVHLMECGQSQRTGKMLLTMIKVIQGNKALYTVTRIWRVEPPAPQLGEEPATSAIDQSQVAAWAQSLRSVKLCDDTLAAHRCAKTDPPQDP